MPYSVGLISTSSGQRIWPPEEIARAEQFLEEAGRVLEALGFGVLKHQKIVCNAEDGVAAGQEIRHRGADVLVCYIGGWSYSTGVVAAAVEAGLPLILYSKMPGQEDGNVDYVVDEQAGVWAPEPVEVVRALRKWVQNPTARQQTARNSLNLARPQASREIARLLISQIKTDI